MGEEHVMPDSKLRPHPTFEGLVTYCVQCDTTVPFPSLIVDTGGKLKCPLCKSNIDKTIEGA
jgi:uncharacterized paraquat-inducible protein A